MKIFLKIYATCCVLGIHEICMTLSGFSLKKCQLKSTCLVLSYCTGLLEMLINIFLSEYNFRGWLSIVFKSFRNRFIQKAHICLVQQLGTHLQYSYYSICFFESPDFSFEGAISRCRPSVIYTSSPLCINEFFFIYADTFLEQ